MSEVFEMLAKPRGFESSAIQLTQNIWKTEQELDMIYSSAKKAFESYSDPGDTGLMLQVDGTLVMKYATEEECLRKFEQLKKKIASSSLPKIKYSKPSVETFKITKRVEGSLEKVVPSSLIKFLRGPSEKVKYDPRRIFYEFSDPNNTKNFVKITFDRASDATKLLLDIVVESNTVPYARTTVRKVEKLLRE